MFSPTNILSFPLSFFQDGQAYCSHECLHTYSHSSKRQSYNPSYSASEYAQSTDSNFDPYETVRTPTRPAWPVDKGHVGIHAWASSIIPGTPNDTCSESRLSTSFASSRPPPKLIKSQQQPVAPTLCMSRTTPAPPEPSRPILTPQQSLHSLSSHSVTEASLTSMTTALSSASIATPGSIRTPASESVSGEPEDPPSAETQRPGFISNLAAHLRSWASSSQQPSSHAVRSKTVTRHSRPSFERVEQPPPILPARNRSPPSVFALPQPLLSTARNEKIVSNTGRIEKSDNHHRRSEEHPAFRSRGRKPSRFAS
ncbi:hypothetical protein C8Q75DRAFT_191214 [Abortiporus biennis]|nr:hypothetical protein C8Q75DRAFT_191214 [Abortiporus biennis]